MFHPSDRNQFLRYWCIPIFLVVIAGNHMYRVHVFNQSSWGAGCGFGMFAKVDYHDSRFFRCTVKTRENQILNAFFRPAAKDYDLKTRVVPTSTNLAELANQLSKQDWYEIVIFRSETDTQPLETIASTDPNVTDYLKSQYADFQPYWQKKPIIIDSLNLEVCGVRMDLSRQSLRSFPINKIQLNRNSRDDVAVNTTVF